MHTRTRPRASSTNTRERPIAPRSRPDHKSSAVSHPRLMSFTEKKSAQAKPPRRARRAPGHRTHAAEPGDETAADEKSATSTGSGATIHPSPHRDHHTDIHQSHAQASTWSSLSLVYSCLHARRLALIYLSCYLYTHTKAVRSFPSPCSSPRGGREREKGEVHTYTSRTPLARRHTQWRSPQRASRFGRLQELRLRGSYLVGQ